MGSPWTAFGPFARRDAPIALLLGAAVVSLAFLSPPTVFEGPDSIRLHLPNRVHLAQRLARGELPLWNPHVGLGRPFLADIEVEAFYPPHLLSLLLEPVVAVSLLAMLHCALAILGMRALCRYLGAAEGAAWAAGMVFVCAAPIGEWMHAGQFPYTWGLCWLPACFLLAARLHDRPSWPAMVALSVALALQLLAGHPQIAWITWLGLACFYLGRSAWGSLEDLAGLARRLAWLVLALGFVFALTAVQLLPFLELAGQGNRTSSSGFAAAGAFPAAGWATLLGSPARYWRFLLYVGAAPLLAGACGLMRVGDRDRRALALSALGGCLIAAGDATPAFAVLSRVVPGMGMLHGHARAAVLLPFALIVSAALWLGSVPRPRREWRGLALATAAALAGIAWAGRGSLFAADDVRTLALRMAVFLGAAALLLRVRTRARSSRAGVWAAAGLALVTTGDLAWNMNRLKRALPPADDLKAEPAVVRALHSAKLFDPNGAPPRLSVPYWIVRDNGGLLYGYSTFTGYVALTLDRVWVYLHAMLDVPASHVENTYPSLRIYDFGPFPYRTMNLVLGFDTRSRKLVVAPDPDPRAWVVTRARVVPDWREAIRLLRAGHDPHVEALLEPTAVDLGPPAPSGPGVTARIVRFGPERVEILARSDSPGWLVLAEAWYPGWKATVDGNPRPCLPANAWMRAVPIPAGESRVVLSYRSRWLAWGALVSGAAVAAAVASLRLIRRA